MNARRAPRSARRRALLVAGALCALPPGARASVPASGAPRVVAIGGALTEIVYRLHAEALLVGADTTSLHPPAALALPRVGYARTLSAEGVLSLRPNLVLASADAGPPAVLAQLRAAGVRLVRTDAEHSFEGLVRNVRIVAEALGRGEAGARLASALEREWHAVQARLRAPAPRPRAMFVLAHAAASVQVSGAGTAAHAMLELAGATNGLTGFNGYRPLTAEAAIGAAPDVIVTTSQGIDALGSVDALLSRPGLALTPAGRARRVAAFEALYLLGFGPRLPQAVEELGRRLGSIT
jgi:iron complex transport system substrate-binding protein